MKLFWKFSYKKITTKYWIIVQYLVVIAYTRGFHDLKLFINRINSG